MGAFNPVWIRGLLWGLAGVVLVLLAPLRAHADNVPYLVKDIRPFDSSYPSEFTPLHGKMYFTADDGTHGRELWVSDGTSDGTYMVKDINKEGSSGPGHLERVGDWIYFSASTPKHKSALWRTDGTNAGTTRVADIGASRYGIYFIRNMNGKLYFGAHTLKYGDELWTSDGTKQGTRLVRDIRPNAASSDVGYLFAYKNKVLFQAQDAEHGRELWITDGTPQGTHMVKDLNPTDEYQSNSDPSDFANLNGVVYFSAYASGYPRLWRTDGTEAGTWQVTAENSITKDLLYPGWLTVYQGRILFEGYLPEVGYELIQTDGTPEGTQLVKDIWKGELGSYPGAFTPYKHELLFFAEHDDNYEVWKTNGTPQGTVQVRSQRPAVDSSPSGFLKAKKKAFFGDHDANGAYALWETDGTEDGTRRIAVIDTRTNEQASQWFMRYSSTVGNTLFFAGFVNGGMELWAYTP